MKYGNKVAVCYDGKLSRSVEGMVTKTRNGHHIKVRFPLWAEEEEKIVECWFRVKRSWKKRVKYYAGYVRHENAFMPKLAGWLGQEIPGDYYAVYKWR